MGLVSLRNWKNNTVFRASNSFEMNSRISSFFLGGGGVSKVLHYAGEIIVKGKSLNLQFFCVNQRPEMFSYFCPFVSAIYPSSANALQM